jgi:hypothetical protein
MQHYIENNPAVPNVLATELEKVIDDFVNQLKQQLVQGWTNPQNQRGVMDRLKGWWSNLWHGRYNQNNPYFWKNKLGDDLGQTTEAVMPLKHYGFLTQQATLLEEALPAGTEKLQIIRVIDNWAKGFKAAIFNLVQNNPSDALPETKPEEPAPQTKPTVEPTPQVDSQWQQSSLERLSKIKDKISPERFETIKNKIADNDKLFVDQSLDILEKFAASAEVPTRTAPMKPPENAKKSWTGPTSTKGKNWAELSPHEQLEWDRWGGGNAGDVTPLAKMRGVNTLPWILRVGDPRLKIIQELAGRSLYDRMVRQKRIEIPSDPIRSEEELQQAIAVAAKIRDEEREKHSARNKATAERLRLQKQPEVTPATPTEPEVKQPEIKKPEIKQPEVTPATPTEPEVKEVPTKPKRRTAPLKVPPEKTAKKNSNPKFNELKSRITALQGQIEPELYQRLERMAKRLENDAKPEYLEKLEDHIKDIESDIKEAQKKKQKENEADNLEYDGGLDAFECTRVEHTQTLINNFRMLARR